MNSAAEFQALNLLGSAPVFLVWLAGLLLCLRFYNSRPVTSLLTGAALLLSAATRIALPSLVTILFTLFGQNILNTGTRIFINSFVFAIPTAIAWAILLWVIFAVKERERPHWSSQPPDIRQ